MTHELEHSLEVTEYQARKSVIRMVCFQMVFMYIMEFDASQPVVAAQSIANIVKSSLGPLGLDKMLVDNIGVCNTITDFVSLLQLLC